MSHSHDPSPASSQPGDAAPDGLRPPLPLLALFFLSGVSGLVFEIVWVRALGLHFGTGAPAVATTVAAFMGGLALGNLLLGPRADRNRDPLRLYVRLELGIGLTGLVVSMLVLEGDLLLAPLARLVSELGPAGGLIRLLVLFGLLLVPTTLMGGTLPTMSRALARGGLQGRVVGGLYALNTAGAIVGALLPDLLLVPRVGLASTVGVAALGNLVVALGVGRLRLAASAPATPPSTRPTLRLPPAALAIYGVSGLCAMSYQVVWSRVIHHWSSGLVVSFSILLAVFLACLTLGSAAASRVADRAERPLLAAALCLAATGPAVYLPLAFAPPGPGFFGLFGSTAAGALRPGLVEVAFETLVQAAWLQFVPCVLMGACFPFLAAAAVRVGDTGRATGRLYAANTLAGVLGALLTGFVLLPALGAQASLLVAAAAATAVGVVCAWSQSDGARIRRFAAIGLLLVLGIGGAISNADQLRRSYFRLPGVRIDVLREGTTTTAAKATRVLFGEDADLLLLTPGVVMSGGEFSAQRYMGLMAHVPLQLAAKTDEALLICFGLGNTARSLLSHEELGHLDVVDISPEVLSLSGEFAPIHGGDPLADPRVTVHVADGRQHLLTTETRYDAITLEPPPPAHAGVVNLYTREFYRAARARLAEGGALAQWLPIFLLDNDQILAIVAAFTDEFPDSALYYGHGYQWILLGTNGPMSIDPAVWQRRAEAPGAAEDLRRIGVQGIGDLVGGFMRGPESLRALTRGVRPVTDDFPIVSYPMRPLAAVEYPEGMLGDGHLGLRLLVEGADPSETSALGRTLRAAAQANGLVQGVVPLLPSRDGPVRDLLVGRSVYRALRLQPGSEHLYALVGVGREWMDPLEASGTLAPDAWLTLGLRHFYDADFPAVLSALDRGGHAGRSSTARYWLLRGGAERALGLPEAAASFARAAELALDPWLREQLLALSGAADAPIDPAAGPWALPKDAGRGGSTAPRGALGEP